ncbi:MAG: alpha/beta hydrolase [Solirubrobacteraceae bacterium]|nr:alpha/beta hydrolase [Patulibacter sp.]
MSQSVLTPEASQPDVPPAPVARDFGPASPHSRILFWLLRAFAYPFVVNWRPTRRGIHFLRWLYGTVIQFPAMKGTVVERRIIGGTPAEWTTTPRSGEAGRRERVILYIHGGGYVFGSPGTHRNLVSRLSHVTATPVANLDYRMPPETSLQGSQNDVFAAYEGLLADGYAAESIVVAGDSAGGGHAAHLVLRAIDEGVPLPAGLIMLSPWTDLTASGESFISNGRYDFVIVKSILDRIARALAPTLEAQRDWRRSPAFAPPEMLAQFPPTLVQVGGRETLRDDGLAFARRLALAGGRVETQTYAGQGHVVAMWSGTPESRRAMREIFRWLKLSLPDERDPSDPTAADLAAADDAGPVDPIL